MSKPKEFRTLKLLMRLGGTALLIPWALLSSDGVFASEKKNESSSQSAPKPVASKKHIEVVAKELDAPARTVFIRLGSVKGASKYEVEVRSSAQRWKNPYRFLTSTGKLRIRLTPAKYTVRTRSVGKGNQRGLWSEWSPMVIPFRSVADVVPSQWASIPNTGLDVQHQTFEWPKVKKAKGYYIEIRDETDEVVRQVRTVATWLTTPLKTAAGYRWCVLPLSDFENETPHVESCRYVNFVIEDTKEELPAALARIEANPDAIGYQYEIVRYENAESVGDPIIVESETPTLRAQLKPGEYEMRARTLFADHHLSNWSPPEKFFVKFPPPEPIGPVLGADIEAGENGDGGVTLRWKAIPGTERYEVYVFDAQGKIHFQKVTKRTAIRARLPEGIRYYWKVVGYSPREPNRAPASVVNTQGASEFYVKPYLPYKFTVSENPAPIYSWARYTLSSADYYSESFDDNAIVRQAIQAGELDVAIGYWHRKSRVGLLAQGGVEGYKTNVDSAYFKSASLNVGYRFVGEGTSRGKVWLGVGYREIASLTANPSTLRYEIKSLNAVGPKLQFTYANQFTDTWGYQLHGKGFLGLKDMGTPNNGAQSTQLLLSLSASVTHPLSRRTLGLLGYTYQLGSGSYASIDTPGQVNTTKITGHYLTLGVEFALSEIKK